MNISDDELQRFYAISQQIAARRGKPANTLDMPSNVELTEGQVKWLKTQQTTVMRNGKVVEL